MRSFLGLVGLLGLVSLGCPPEKQPPPGYPGYGQPAGYGQPPGQGQMYPGRPPVPAQPQPQPYPHQGYAMPQHAAQAPGQPASPQPGTLAPGQQPPAPVQPVTPLAPFGPPDPGGPATPIHLAHMQQALPALDQLAVRNMINMQPDGEPFAAQFNNGHILEHTFEIVPGRCYGVVAVGMGITELELALVVGDSPVDHIMGADGLKGPQAVIGPSGKCIHNPLPSPNEARVVVTAAAGAGTAVARIYSK